MQINHIGLDYAIFFSIDTGLNFYYIQLKLVPTIHLGCNNWIIIKDLRSEHTCKIASYANNYSVNMLRRVDFLWTYDAQKSFIIKATRLRELLEISEVTHKNKHRRYLSFYINNPEGK